MKIYKKENLQFTIKQNLQVNKAQIEIRRETDLKLVVEFMFKVNCIYNVLKND